MASSVKHQKTCLQLKTASRLVHSGVERTPLGETAEALFLTQGFVYDSAESAEARFKGEEPGYIYSRYANPTVTMFEQRMCALEGAEAALATASGMGAVSAALLCQLKSGDHVVAARALFGSCRYIIEKLLPQYGIEITLVNGAELDEWSRAFRRNTRVLFLESPTNPTLEIVDIAAVAELANQNGACLVVDNVFATPMFQKPLELGAHVVVYSATKHIDGQGRCLGGVVLSSQEWIDEKLYDYFRHTGPSLSPFNAWVLLKGLETLPLRVERQTSNAYQVAEFLGTNSKIIRILYPGRDDHPQAEIARKQMSGGSTLVAFEVDGGKAAAFRYLNALEMIKISNNLGDAKSLITHPATTTHRNLDPADRESLGIRGGMLRLSLGIEDPADILDDLRRALDAV